MRDEGNFSTHPQRSRRHNDKRMLLRAQKRKWIELEEEEVEGESVHRCTEYSANEEEVTSTSLLRMAYIAKS